MVQLKAVKGKVLVIGPKTGILWGRYQAGDEFLIHRQDFESLRRVLVKVDQN